jgi:hypothetical protein
MPPASSRGDRSRRILSGAMAGLLALAVITVWV